MIDDFELMENNFGREGNQMWVFDYMRTTDQQWNTTTKLNMDHFEKFITTFPYKDWQTACQYDLSNKTHPVIKKMLYMATNIGVSSIREKLILMEKVRNKTNLYYETFKIIPFDTDSISIDIVKQTWDSMTYATSFLAVGILVLLTFLIPQIATWSVAAFSIISSIFCFIVYSNFLVPQITPFSIVTIIIFVVTISTIIVIQIYEFYRLLDVQGRRKRIAATFNNVSFILYIAALSTIASSIPLLFCQVSLYYDCAVFIITAMTIILVQFTYFVPALFAILPRSLVSD
uniref:SSD domain-containing protein n=1 Tax=Rhabditophanes sp. KR3021 TaxID=114890 RepID=A0AC35UDP2_9BILA